jgi:hypothetical protein
MPYCGSSTEYSLLRSPRPSTHHPWPTLGRPHPQGSNRPPALHTQHCPLGKVPSTAATGDGPRAATATAVLPPSMLPNCRRDVAVSPATIAAVTEFLAKIASLAVTSAVSGVL